MHLQSNGAHVSIRHANNMHCGCKESALLPTVGEVQFGHVTPRLTV